MTKMSVYKIGWTLVDGIDGNIRGTDRMWFDKVPDKHNALWRLDRIMNLNLDDKAKKMIAHNFYLAQMRATALEDFNVRYIKEDRFRSGDIALVGEEHSVRTRKGMITYPPTKLTIKQVRGNIVIGRTFGVGNSEMKYFLKDLVLLKAREEK